MKKGWASTSPSKVYAKRERTADFLLGAGLRKLDSQRSQVALELFRGLEDDASHAEAPRRFCIGGNIVDIDGLLRAHFAGFEGFSIDKRNRLASPYAEGVDASGKQSEEGEASFCMSHVQGVSIGKQGEAIVLGELFEERILVDRVGVESTIPDFAELLEIQRCTKSLV